MKNHNDRYFKNHNDILLFLLYTGLLFYLQNLLSREQVIVVT